MPIPGGPPPANPMITTTVVRPCYTTREAVAGALDVRPGAGANRAIDKAIQAATEDVDAFCHRTFTPTLTSRTFDWPTRQSSQPGQLWLDANELIRLDAASVGGQPLDLAAVLTRPDTGPPYSRIELDRSTSASFTTTGTAQRAITLTGLWGYQDTQAAAGTLTGNIATVDEVIIAVSDSTTIGIGDLLQVGDERMLVTGRRTADTGWTLTANLAQNAGANGLAVADGDQFIPGEIITVDGERMRIDDIAGNTLIVKRAFDGTVLAAHTAGAVIYAGRQLTVARAATGTTAATHTQGAAISRHSPPALVSRFAQAHAIVTVLQDPAGWARTVGSGDSERQASGAALVRAREELYGALARKARTR